MRLDDWPRGGDFSHGDACVCVGFGFRMWLVWHVCGVVWHRLLFFFFCFFFPLVPLGVQQRLSQDTKGSRCMELMTKTFGSFKRRRGVPNIGKPLEGIGMVRHGACHGVVWCGVVWSGVGVVWCGVVWCGVVWCGVAGRWCGHAHAALCVVVLRCYVRCGWDGRHTVWTRRGAACVPRVTACAIGLRWAHRFSVS